MPEQSKTPQNPFFWELKIFNLSLVFLVATINYIISLFIRNSGINFIDNFTPIGFSFGLFVSFLIIIAITLILLAIKIIDSNPIASILILSGVYSNFFEKLINGSVADYIQFGSGAMNLADMQILVGVFILVASLWTLKEKNEDPFLISTQESNEEFI